MRPLYTLALPRVCDADAALIDNFRRSHDPHWQVVAAHFTIAFGCSSVPEEIYTAHVAEVCRSMRPVDFVCRHAMLGADAESALAYVYLVPDEGFSGLSRLHDGIHTGPLEATLRLDIPFVPHITLASTADRIAAKRLCDTLNEARLDIRGTVCALTVAALQDRRIIKLAQFPLSA